MFRCWYFPAFQLYTIGDKACLHERSRTSPSRTSPNNGSLSSSSLRAWWGSKIPCRKGADTRSHSHFGDVVRRRPLRPSASTPTTQYSRFSMKPLTVPPHIRLPVQKLQDCPTPGVAASGGRSWVDHRNYPSKRFMPKGPLFFHCGDKNCQLRVFGRSALDSRLTFTSLRVATGLTAVVIKTEQVLDVSEGLAPLVIGCSYRSLFFACALLRRTSTCHAVHVAMIAGHKSHNAVP